MSADAELKYKQAIARVELRSAGVPEKRLGAAVRQIDYDAVSVDKGELVGLDEQIEELRADWPEMFAAEKPAEEPEAEAAIEEVDESRLSETERQSLIILRGSGDPYAAEGILDRHRAEGRRWVDQQKAGVVPDEAFEATLTGSQRQALLVLRSGGRYGEARELLDKAKPKVDTATVQLARALGYDPEAA